MRCAARNSSATVIWATSEAMVASDPARRFPSAEDADLVKEGAASFHRQLIVGGLASEYENEIRAWLELLE